MTAARTAPVDRETVVMITTSYPRFPGDTIGTFMEPIARGLAARGHLVHVVLPWHPRLRRAPVEDGVHFHPFRYAPFRSLNVFGYAGALSEDVRLRRSAWVAAPLALAAGLGAARAVIGRTHATVVHGHWVVPGGAIAAAAAGSLPLVISLHGSDVYVAERHAAARSVARAVFRRAGWVTACSDDLRVRAIALGAPQDRAETLPYGVDAGRFKPDAAARAAVRRALGVGADDLLLFAAGRFVRKKGFEFLIDAMAILVRRWPALVLVIGGGGDLDAELRSRAAALGLENRVRFPGVLGHDQVAEHLAAADIAVVPSVHDEAGNVDGLPNVVMEALASGTPVVATTAGGIPAAVRDQETGRLVPERDPAALADAIDALLGDP
ncbi:MAG: glycosyltransferase, partial [Acidobacteria bacterium]|nr:glycosyltransferase [Acidobacteriota bacterium]